MIYILSIIAIFLNSQLLASINSLSRARDDFKNVLNITAKVGSSVTLKCSIDSITYGNGPGVCLLSYAYLFNYLSNMFIYLIIIKRSYGLKVNWEMFLH